MTFRCTSKARKKLRLAVADLADAPSSTAATEWHCNVVTLGRRPFFLFAHSLSLFGFLVPAAGNSAFESFGDMFRGHANEVLQIEGMHGDTAGKILDDGPDRFCRAADRGVLGSMVDFANMCRFLIDDEGHVDPIVLHRAHELINESPMSRLNMESPRRALRTLLGEGRRI